MADQDEQTKALHQQADARKRDLTDGADVHVPDGTEATPPPRVDPFAGRKAMFVKADANRDAEAAQGGSIQDARLREAAQEAGIDLDALTRGHLPVGAPTAPASERTLHLKKTTPDADASTGTSQNQDARVTLTLNGAPISVTQRDVDRAGGVENYLRRRELDAEAERLALTQAQLQQELDAARKLRQELEQGATHSAAHGTEPANRAAAPAAQDRNDPGNTGVEDDRLAERLADQIYSGDQEEAQKGIRELIRLARQRGETIDTRAIVEQVRTEMGAASQAEGHNSPRKADPAIDRVNREINAMSLAEFPDLMKDAAGRAAAYERFCELVKKPENADRLAVDVAREALEEIEPRFVQARAQVVERKRGLQATSAASGALREEPGVEQDASAIVAQMAASRNFGRRPPQ